MLLADAQVSAQRSPPNSRVPSAEKNMSKTAVVDLRVARTQKHAMDKGSD